MSTVDHHEHFSRLASDYRRVRTTDIEPILYISKIMKGVPQINAADIGCGAGRYCLFLLEHLNNPHLVCVDINEAMLEETSRYLNRNGATNFRTFRASADSFALEPKSMDCLFTFNAIHHFDFVKFLKGACEALRPGGRLFIYTRLRSQNARNIWGRHFPRFSEIETRLHELDVMVKWTESVDSMELETAKYFKYERSASLVELVEKVRARHYSTFSLYSPEDLAVSLEIFKKNIAKAFQDLDNIKWVDENILLVIKSHKTNP